MLGIVPGPLYFALQGFIAVSILVANVVLFRAWRRSPPRERGPMFTMMLASLIPWFANVTYLAGLVPWSLDGPPFFLLPIAGLFAWSVRHQGLVELRDRRNRPSGRVLVFHDVTTYERMHRNLERLATTDGLTGLPNRRRFFDVARRWIARDRGTGRPSAWLVLDIDHFKRVNDRYGHDAGDRVLKAVAAAMIADLRSDDLVARMGGEEFAMFLPATARADALMVAERLRTSIAAIRTSVGDGEVAVTVSIGVCVRSGGDLDIDEVLAAADAALYRAKNEGRDRVVVGDPCELGRELQVAAVASTGS